MENNDLKYIIDTVQKKTGYLLNYYEIDEDGWFDIRFKTPSPEYLGIHFNPEKLRIEILYWEDLNFPYSPTTYTSNYDDQDNQTITYQECLSQFLNFL